MIKEDARQENNVRVLAEHGIYFNKPDVFKVVTFPTEGDVIDIFTRQYILIEAPKKSKRGKK